MASGGPSSPGCSGVEGGLWGAASTPVRRGGRVQVCAGAEHVCTGAGQGPLLAGSSHDGLREMGGPPPSSQIPCLWIHLLTQVCGLDIGLRGGFCGHACRQVQRHLRMVAGGEVPGVQDAHAPEPLGKVRSPAPAPVLGAASGSSPHAGAPRFLLCKMQQASPSRRIRESRF